VKFLTKEQETESKHFKDPANSNVDLEVTDKVGGRPVSGCWLSQVGAQPVCGLS
jgi:hypothetical protein